MKKAEEARMHEQTHAIITKINAGLRSVQKWPLKVEAEVTQSEWREDVGKRFEHVVDKLEQEEFNADWSHHADECVDGIIIAITIHGRLPPKSLTQLLSKRSDNPFAALPLAIAAAASAATSPSSSSGSGLPPPIPSPAIAYPRFGVGYAQQMQQEQVYDTVKP